MLIKLYAFVHYNIFSGSFLECKSFFLFDLVKKTLNVTNVVLTLVNNESGTTLSTITVH